MTPEEFTRLVRSLIALGRETEWVEFKHNNADPQEIGENVSAVSNGSAFHQKATGYLLWGVADETLKIVGTSFRPRQMKKGNEELENWLLRLLQPRLDVRIHEGEVDGHHTCLMFVSGKRMTNATLRKRLGIEKRNYPQASKIIRETMELGLIKQYEGGSESSRDRSYLPFWA